MGEVPPYNIHAHVHGISASTIGGSLNSSRGAMLKVVGASWEKTRASSYFLGVFTLLGLIIIIYGGSITRFENDGNYAATVYWQAEVGYRIEFWGQGNVLENVPKGSARGYYRQDIANIGWSKVEIETNGEYPDWVQAYSAGLLEGSLTWQLVYWRWKNTIETVCMERADDCDAIRKRLASWGERMRTYSVHMSELDPFWHQIRLFFAQLDGIETGWNYALKRNRRHFEIESEDFLWMNFLATDVPLPDIQDLLPHTPSLASALIKLNRSANNSEIFVAHAKAGAYRDMLKIVKRYSFEFRMTAAEGASQTPGNVLTFTGYPGAISSQDTLYAVDSKHLVKHSLIVSGSVIGHDQLKDKRIRMRRQAEEQVPSSMRALAASRLARDGRTWAAYFSRARDGECIAKQWTIVDLSKVNNTEADGLLWVIEQTTGVLMSSDQSEVLKTEGYWASYGLPYHQEIRLAMNLPDDNEKMYSYTQSMRSQVFSTCKENCTSKKEIFELIRNAVTPSEDLFGSRADLYQVGAVPFGVVDTKIITGSQSETPVFEIVAGPVYAENTTAAEVPPEGTVSPFQWSTSGFFDVEHTGHPDIWRFPTTTPEWSWN